MSAGTATKTARERADEIKRIADAKLAEAAALEAAASTPVSKATPLTVAAQPKTGDEGRFFFKSFGHYLHEVKNCTPQNPSEFLRKIYGSEVVMKAATGMGELIGSDGGFLVPPTFSNKIFERMYSENDLLAKTDNYVVTGNSMVFPRNNESSRANGSRWGGVRAYWVQEGTTITASAPTFGRLTLNLHKLACTTPVTSELIKDSGTPMEAYLTRVFASEIAFAVGSSIVRGTGAGQPLGLINSPCTVSVSAEAGQAASTILSQNLVKMWSRRFALGSTGSYVWLVNQDVGPQLHLLTLGIGTAGVVTYMPPGGLSAKPYATLMGAPVMETEWNSTLGTVGDIILVDLSQFVTINQGGVESMSSMHVYFLSDQQAFRSTFRADGACWQADALTPANGSNTQSPIITLATR